MQTLKGFKLKDEYKDLTIEVPIHLSEIMRAIKDAGGEPYLVGGYVRDAVMGLDPKDIDVEVFNMEQNVLIGILSDFGKVDEVGKSFGVVKLRTKDDEFDFSIPRRERKTGEGHKEFEIETDPTMSLDEASSRRDLTINALYATYTGHVVDNRSGLADIKGGMIRHVSDRFREDPLRVLRAMQFAGRYGYKLHPSTANMAKELKSEFKTIPIERIWGEWYKWALKSKKPSAGLKVLEQTGWIEFFQNLNLMRGIPQNDTHPEGHTWIHAMMSTDKAVEIANRENLSPEQRLILVFAALCHDMGKVPKTKAKDGRWDSTGHEEAGVRLCGEFLQSIGAPTFIFEHASKLIRQHSIWDVQHTGEGMRKLAVDLSPSNIKMLGYLVECDNYEVDDDLRKLIVSAKKFGVMEHPPEPIFGGKDILQLAEAGVLPAGYLNPGPDFGKLIDWMYEYQLLGYFSDIRGAGRLIHTMFHDKGMETLTFLAELSEKDKLKLVTSAEAAGIQKPEDIPNMSVEAIKRLLE